MNERTLTTKEAAKYLGISESTLRQGRMNGARRNRIPPPPFVKLGRKILADLDQWLTQHRVNLVDFQEK